MRDAAVPDGCAADPRHFPYGTRLIVDGRLCVVDDTFGKAQRDRDWAAGVVHLDIRVALPGLSPEEHHAAVSRMGAGWVEVEVLAKGGGR